MRGDHEDFVSRLRLTLPDGWFGDEAPVLGGLLAGLASGWAGLYGLLQTVRLQSRLATVTERFLDLACVDFFGGRLARRVGEVDDALRGRLLRAMRRERGTRAGVVAAAGEAGFAASVFEAARPADTGAYSTAGQLAWNVSGGWGSLAMPLESLVTLRGGGAVMGAVDAEISAALPAGGVAWVRVAG